MPSQAAEVSVIIPAYRAAGTITRALQSVARQTRPPAEVIVVDDGSDDGTRAAAEACRSLLGDIRLSVLDQENAGAGAARNRALEQARYATVAFLDADDEWLPEKLERTLPHLEGTDNVLVAHNFIRLEPDGRETIVDSLGRMSLGEPFVSLYRRGYIGTTTVIARKDAIDDAGGFDAGLRTAQDFDLWLAMLETPGTPFAVLPDALARYHVSETGITSHTARRLRCCTEIAVRYFSALKARPGSALASLWFRITALHLEAARAYGARGAEFALTAIWLLFPVRLAAATVRALFHTYRRRTHG